MKIHIFMKFSDFSVSDLKSLIWHWNLQCFMQSGEIMKTIEFLMEKYFYVETFYNDFYFHVASRFFISIEKSHYPNPS